MKQIQTNQSSKKFDDEMDLRELLYILLEGKKIIFSITAFISILAVIISLLMPNIYQSKAILVPVQLSSGPAAALGAYSNLAGLAGINLPPDGDEGNSLKALEKISSLSFFNNNIYTNINLADLIDRKSVV